MLQTRRTASRARRLASIPALVACCALVLTACGDDEGGSDEPFPGAGKTVDRLDAVTISGDVGTAPEVEWKSAMAAGKVETETVTEGDGDALDDGSSVLAHLWIGNGSSQTEVFNTYEDKKPELLTVDDQLPAFLKGIADATVGSRLAVTASAEEAFGEGGNPTLGIGNMDTMLAIVDLVSEVMDAPGGHRAAGAVLDAPHQAQGRGRQRLRLRGRARADRRPAPGPADPGHRPARQEGARRSRSATSARPSARTSRSTRTSATAPAPRRPSPSAPARSSRAGTRGSRASRSAPAWSWRSRRTSATAPRATPTAASPPTPRSSSSSTSSPRPDPGQAPVPRRFRDGRRAPSSTNAGEVAGSEPWRQGRANGSSTC